jgi:hypothetical protein
MREFILKVVKDNMDLIVHEVIYQLVEELEQSIYEALGDDVSDEHKREILDGMMERLSKMGIKKLELKFLSQEQIEKNYCLRSDIERVTIELFNALKRKHG